MTSDGRMDLHKAIQSTKNGGAFLWLTRQRIRLPGQETQVQSRGQEDPLEESLGAQRHGMDRARVGRVSTAEQAWSVPVHLSELIPVNEG